MAEAEETRRNIDEIWGTWEELLLVSAVNKHGIKNWDSVAMEIQNKITSPQHFILTPHVCKQKYQQLRQRFNENQDNTTNTNIDNTIPWLDELRKLRVAELRREVQQYDVSIVSLQLKVKRLTEERERSSKDNQVQPSDLDRTVPEKTISGEDSDRDNQSFNESNSTDLKSENQVTAGVDESDKTQPNKIVAVAGAGAGDLDPVTAEEDKRVVAVVVVEEGSWNGSSETINIAKDSVVSQTLQKSSEPIIKNREAGDSAELWESVESKGEGEGEDAEEEEEGTKENSDVQSSASLSMKNRRKTDVVVSVSSSGDGEGDDISPAIKRISIKSQPLAKFLEMIKSHKYGYVFERRLESQETSKYMSVIRQHLDLEIVNKRLQEGQYSGCSRKFFRDLLVLLNNAIVYFPNNSVEFTAATELRQIVSKEMGLRIQKVDQSPETQELAPPIIPPPALPKLDLEPSDSLLMKQKSSVPMIACRKRSSIIYKAAPERKVEKKEAVVEDKKPAFDRKKQDSLVTLAEEKNVIKKEKRDRPASGTRSSRTVSKSSNRNPSPSSNQASSSKGGTAAEDNSETKAEKEKNNNSTVSKKRSVANFLNRMKKNTSSNGTLLDSLKNSGNSSNNSKGGNAEQKKSSGGRGDVRKEQATRQSVSRRQTRDQSSPAKRSVGRPPKRNASSPITPPVSSKRSRETTETEAAASRQPRKRSRR
ncbi:hypothetical protein AQUCO_03800063v1 [Aquilegia coerulea]|uniref:Bromo domain-containing protein n=1 Tax=Aquilegia coerulea TaxID=218851 RepID=A0A2G5CSE4_AQUCA|nr:hypothetical protein AQUCO_03800063v1 [Aquilegia coerulea]